MIPEDAVNGTVVSGGQSVITLPGTQQALVQAGVTVGDQIYLVADSSQLEAIQVMQVKI